MPTYEYVCDACGHEFELFQQMSAPVKKKCPECAKNTLRRLIGTGAGVIFKGGGFYETDYRSEGYKKAEKAEKEKASGGSEKGEKKDAKKGDSGGGSGSGGEKAASKAESKPAKGGDGKAAGKKKDAG